VLTGPDPVLSPQSEAGFRPLFDGTAATFKNWRLAGPGSGGMLHANGEMVSYGDGGLRLFFLRHGIVRRFYELMGSRKGHGRSVAASSQPDAESMKPPKTASDVRDSLARTMAQVHAHQIEPRTANALAYLATSLLRAIEVSDLEKRLDELELTQRVTGQSQPGHHSDIAPTTA
jgi:hypothetical protein